MFASEREGKQKTELTQSQPTPGILFIKFSISSRNPNISSKVNLSRFQLISTPTGKPHFHLSLKPFGIGTIISASKIFRIKSRGLITVINVIGNLLIAS